MDLFASVHLAEAEKKAPLAVRMRPRSLDEFVGQQHLVGPGRFLRRMLKAGTLPSLLLFGPPGTGKTTLAYLIANAAGCHFEKLNAVAAGVADVRKQVEAAQERLKLYGQRTILFIDEIHRFNKGQQDALLPFVEDGTIILIGATTENPYFEVNSPLLSRMRITKLQPLSEEEIVQILVRALTDERGLGDRRLAWDEGALGHYCPRLPAAMPRIALNILEQAAWQLEETGEGRITAAVLETVMGEKIHRYDKSGDSHYDVISAFIKSLRGSDPDAALHYLARMLEAGEDVNFIARRLVISAAEDVGNADPQALIIANAAAQAVHFIGLPEARIILAQAVTYIACAPKSNAAYLAIEQALADVRGKNYGEVPLHLRDAHYRGAKALGHGQGYLYPHDYPGGWVRQQHLPAPLAGTVYYRPGQLGYERQIRQHLEQLRARHNEDGKVPE
ncbi:AAA ATPase, central domain protein [Thermosinus carboxydivorans Nor1]|uniref:AAA ATPase, central domain protein n=1 Tax=Thermosinus carboxydivorans Nor1 TaxID=401526 RepID=A1HU90_9FIRM|nr:replication-associated recombination protein A [Thermosinus carboxydivorans]EAX46398.1 AAA ATPase, central domain protein [Thermosinus carboxydivorans Nor1]